jgi:hypothetical protein
VSQAPEPAEDPVISLHQVAREIGCHYDTARKNWRAWAGVQGDRDAYIGFPFPCRYGRVGTRGVLGWRLSVITEWKVRRERALGEGRSAPGEALQGRPRNDPYVTTTPRLKTERAQLQQLLERA